MPTSRESTNEKTPAGAGVKGRMWTRAGDGIRTRDIKHGKLVLYQLSYSRSAPCSCVRQKALDHDVERTVGLPRAGSHFRRPMHWTDALEGCTDENRPDGPRARPP